MPKSIRELSVDAMQIQNACNLSGVVHSFSRAMSDLREAIPGQGTDFYNSHPVAVMYASKIASLTRCDESRVFGDAYEVCANLATQTESEARCFNS